MFSCWRAHALGCAVLGVVLVWRGSASAAEDQEKQAATEARSEDVRLDLGLGLLGPTSSGGAGAGTLGITALMPITRAAIEAHMTGPAWFVIAANGGYETTTFNGDEGESWFASLRLGPRFEAAVVEKVEAGGYVLAEAVLGRTELAGYGDSKLQIGAVAGGSLHFRPTPVFGVRLALDVLRGGYQRSAMGADEASSGYVRLTASPWIELTFTF